MIVCIFGAQGSGKTLYLCKEGYSNYKKGRKVYSNFKLMFPFTPLRFDDIINTRLENCTCLIDEAHLWGLNARTSMSKANIAITNAFIAQCRKKGVDLFVNSQLPRNIDIRVRENASYYIFCTKYVRLKTGWVEAVEGLDYDAVPTYIYVEIVNMASEKVVKSGFEAHTLFGLYDTKEIIRQQ